MKASTKSITKRLGCERKWIEAQIWWKLKQIWIGSSQTDGTCFPIMNWNIFRIMSWLFIHVVSFAHDWNQVVLKIEIPGECQTSKKCFCSLYKENDQSAWFSDKSRGSNRIHYCYWIKDLKRFIEVEWFTLLIADKV